MFSWMQADLGTGKIFEYYHIGLLIRLWGIQRGSGWGAGGGGGVVAECESAVSYGN